MQQTFLAEEDLSLEKPPQISQAAEEAKLGTETLRGDMISYTPTQDDTAFTVTEPTTGGRRQEQTGNNTQPCYRCDQRGHDPERCYFKNRTCHYCKMRGRIIKECRKKKQDGGAATTRQERKLSEGTATHQIESEEVSFIYSLSRKGVVAVTLKFAGKTLEMEVDTGDTVTAVPVELCQLQLPRVHLRPSSIKLQAYSGERLKVKGEAIYGVRKVWDSTIVGEADSGGCSQQARGIGTQLAGPH